MSPLRMFGFHCSTAVAAAPPVIDPYDNTGIPDRVGLWDPRNVVKDGSNFVSEWTECYATGLDFEQATAANQAQWLANQFGTKPGVLDDGSNDKYFLDFGSSYATGTVAVVIKAGTLRRYNGIWCTEDDPSNPGVPNQGITLEDGGGAFGLSKLDTWVNNKGARAVTTAGSYLTATNYAVFCTYNGATINIWVNGVLVGSEAFAQDGLTNFYRRVWLGVGVGFYAFAGLRGQMRFYSRALTNTELATLYAEWQTEGWI